MSRRLFLILLLGLSTTFVWNAGIFQCFGNEGAVRPSQQLSLSASTASDSSRPHNHLSTFGAGDYDQFAYFSNGNNGSRQLNLASGRLLLALRFVDSGETLSRNDFSQVDDIRSLYGFVRPHLFLCRLLI